eukprot:TRINITY_DN10552_c0_g1_i1.p1 TRINITY_DN10552_c0_g1~~TRINITY_DN10552_c0_g1_i1.p1  ORF type:complete len:385 (+),score=95.03 TRINITY_DN10552_c0_g1_i1:72-1226(+)
MMRRGSSGPPKALQGPLAVAVLIGVWLLVQHWRRAAPLAPGRGSSAEEEVGRLQAALVREAQQAAKAHADLAGQALRRELSQLEAQLEQLRRGRSGGALAVASRPGNDDIMIGKYLMRRHQHYEATYDLRHLKPPPPGYEYPENPPFLYAPDVPTFPKDLPYLLVSNQPKAFYFPGLLSAAEADAIIAEGRKRMSRSQVGVDANRTEQGKVSDERTSDGCWLSESNPAAHVLRERIRRITGFDENHMELTQVLRYQRNQKYNQHVDFIDPVWHQDGMEIDSQRAATFLVSLVDLPPESGGETVLPMANSGPEAPGYGLTCERGLRIRPRKGGGILLYDMHPNKRLDPYSLHGACPVISGEKWMAVQWLRVPGKWDKAHGREAVW